MTAHKPLVVDFKDIDKHDLPLVGGKAANLGEMTKAGFPVPSGFSVTVHAYDLFLAENSLNDFLKDTLKGLKVEKTEELQRVAKTIQNRIKKSHIPEKVAKEVFSAYKKMSKKLVAIRSSATAEDLPTASFAGQQETFLNVQGDAAVLDKVRACWASLFTARAIFYREENKIKHENVKISVIIQKMLASEVSGVMFTIDPVTNNKERIIIEAVWGLGELLVQGTVVPDRYVVQKETFSILSKEISEQAIQLIKVNEQNKEVDVPKKIRDKQKISDKEIIVLAKIGSELQKHYYFPQDVEWVKQKKDLFIVQTRPVTTIKQKKVIVEKPKDEAKGEIIKTALSPILKGTAASPGIGTGHVKLIKDPKQIGKIKPGDILVAEMTSPDFVPAMKRAAGIVTDKGGQTSHAAIVSRELGIPCVVGAKTATRELKEGTVITVDGSTGLIFLGSKVKIQKKQAKPVKKILSKTATKLYVNLGEPELARKISHKNIDGVGLLRAEFMIANIGIHPREAIKQKKQADFVKKLTNDLATFCRAFGERPVVYRASDFKTNEYRSLPGGKAWEPEEPNPMLGFRGAFRYIARPEVFMLELRAIKKVRKKHKNLWLMIPFVRSPEELAKIRRLVAVEGFFESESFKFWMMVELPVNVILLDSFIKVGIDGVSVGSNDLTMLIEGTDRDNSEVASAFDERSPAIMWALRRVARICHKHGITSSICGQAPSVYDDLVKKLVRMGFTSISVNPDAINRVRGVIKEAEKEVATIK